MALTRVRPWITDFAARWMFIALAAFVSAFGMRAMGVSVAMDTLWPQLELVVALIGIAVAYATLGRNVLRLARPAAVASDFLLSAAQVAALIAAILPLTYLSAAPAFPLLDATFARLDLLLFGFKWNIASHWVAAHPMLDTVLQAAYFSILYQCVAVLLLGSVSEPENRNSDFIWSAGVSMILTCIAFVFAPALGTIGHTGSGPVELSMAIRSGRWTVLDNAHSEGIVAFPSFHTTLAILFVWAVRKHRWTLLVFVPLNLLVIAATPTVGGHHLVDLIGGAAVAAASISVTHALGGLLRSRNRAIQTPVRLSSPRHVEA